jgi:exosortase B
MTAATSSVLRQTAVGLTSRSSWPWMSVLVLAVLHCMPTLWDLFTGLWSTPEQAHGPLLLVLSLWLIGRRHKDILVVDQTRAPFLAWSLLLGSSLLYVVGRSQGVLIFEIASVLVLVAGLLLLRGTTAFKAGAFGLFFMFFMVPLPSAWVDALTQPMKIGVSFATENILFYLGYPISRAGVILHIGPYELQVADACAGLNTLFTLEALGLVYLNVVRHTSVIRNVLLAILIVPISFTANVIRVMTLTLITYHFGDEAGQGFLHDFAGMVLFVAALSLIILTDSALRLGVRKAAHP